MVSFSVEKDLLHIWSTADFELDSQAPHCRLTDRPIEDDSHGRSPSIARLNSPVSSEARSKSCSALEQMVVGVENLRRSTSVRARGLRELWQDTSNAGCVALTILLGWVTARIMMLVTCTLSETNSPAFSIEVTHHEH